MQIPTIVNIQYLYLLSRLGESRWYYAADIYSYTFQIILELIFKVCDYDRPT